MKTESKHTSGPWVVGNHGRCVWTQHETDAAADPGLNPDLICTVAGDDMGNARLIAAAPELLEACKLFIEWCKTPEEMVTPEVIEAIHEAVTKAEGL